MSASDPPAEGVWAQAREEMIKMMTWKSGEVLRFMITFRAIITNDSKEHSKLKVYTKLAVILYIFLG